MAMEDSKVVEVFRIFSENYAKPFLSNPKVTTALLLIVLVQLGYNVYDFMGLGEKTKVVEAVPAPTEVVSTPPAPVIRTPEPTVIVKENKFDPTSIERRLTELEKKVDSNTGTLKELYPLHF